MPAFLTDPDIPAEELRQRLYCGDLVILTRLRALGGVRRLHAGRAGQAVRPA